jgi:hypothetical protein
MARTNSSLVNGRSLFFTENGLQNSGIASSSSFFD